MYVIAIKYKVEYTGKYVSMVNYKKDVWDSSERPIIFKNMKSVERCILQVKKYAPALELVVFQMKEV